MNTNIAKAIQNLEDLNKVVRILHDNDGIKVVTETIAELKTAQTKILKAEQALQKISNWHGEFPETRQFWDKEETRPMDYGSCYGSNGERDYMRKIAKEALK